MESQSAKSKLLPCMPRCDLRWAEHHSQHHTCGRASTVRIQLAQIASSARSTGSQGRLAKGTSNHQWHAHCLDGNITKL